MRVTSLSQDTTLRRARLLARIHREFQTVDETIELGSATLRFTRVKDPDAVLDAICQQEIDRQRGIAPRRTLRMPYWAAVWESATALIHFLAQRDQTQPIAGLRTLDLGCGMGLAGAAMAALGARVTLVDIETACLLFAQLNTLSWSDRSYVRRCDWQSDDLGERYAVIVAADVLYEIEQWPFIERFLRRHLARDGIAFIGEPGRPKAEDFADWLRGRGWHVSASNAEAGERTVSIYEATITV